MATQEIVTSEEVQKRMEKLPPDIQALIYSPEMTEIIKRIGNAHRLHLDQLGNLESETAFVMLGFTEPGDFVKVLTERLSTDKVTAASLAEAINNELLQKIRESLKALYPDLPGPGASTRPGVQPGTLPKVVVEPIKPSLRDSLPMQGETQMVNTPPRPVAIEKAPQVSAPEQVPVQNITPTQALPAKPLPPPEISAPVSSPVPQTVAPAPTAVRNAADDALSHPQATTTEKINVGVPPTKPSEYKADPYREPIE